MLIVYYARLVVGSEVVKIGLSATFFALTLLLTQQI